MNAIASPSRDFAALQPVPGPAAPTLTQRARAAGGAASRVDRIILMLAFLALTAYLSYNHVFWKDEVRALSFAIQGDSVIDMFRGVRGDGHPMVWFLILRAGHAIAGPVALPVLAHAIGILAVGLLLWRAPFSLLALALIVISRPVLYEYTVMSRNYGISMLLMFVFAAGYARWRDRGLWLIVPLALLANTNVHSTLIAGLLTAVWLLDVYPGKAAASSWLRSRVVPAGLVMALAALASFLSVWPTINDAAVFVKTPTAQNLGLAYFLPGVQFGPQSAEALPIALFVTAWLLASVLLLRKRPTYLCAALAALVLLSIFFALVYPPSDRHRDLWLLMVITLWWMQRSTDKPEGREANRRHRWLDRIGTVAFTAILATQTVLLGVMAMGIASGTEPPRSRVRDLAGLLASRTDLRGAIVISDPDNMIEPLPYYAPHTPVWRIRQGGYSAINIFTSHGASLDISIADVTRTAQRLHACTGRPVVILLPNAPDPSATRVAKLNYNWTTRYAPAETAQFLAATRRIADLRPAVSDESYTVYLLRTDATARKPENCGAMRYPATSAARGWRLPSAAAP